MKQRFLYLFLCFIAILFSLCACSYKTKDVESKGSKLTNEQKDANVTPLPTGSENLTALSLAYQYEQDLDIIDDNNRNYYEIFVASYCDSDGDGVGDFNGIISKLDYISEMGFNGIWLMPIMPSPSYHKYDSTDYYSVDPSYGTLEDFKSLIKECHKRGIKLIIDYVFNHSSNEHPWFTQAVNYLESLGDEEEPNLTECPYVGYYHFKKDTNGSKSYHKAGNSDWYYECIFYYTQPDLALENKAVLNEFEKATKFWLDMGIDGFRLDAAKEYFSGSTSKNVEILKWFTDFVKKLNKEAYIVAEVFDERQVIASYYQSGVTSMFNFPLAQYDGIIPAAVKKLGTASAKTFINSILEINKQYSAINLNYIDAPFISNHDTTRISAQCANNENHMKMIAGILLTMNGSPFVYYGEEIGMNSMGDKDENKRLPMQWSSTDTSTMTDAPTGAEEVVQKFEPLDLQQKDPLSIINYYKRALRIRNENPEIARGEMSKIDCLVDKNICAIKKVYQGSEIVIVYNINKESAIVDMNSAGYGDSNIRGYMAVDGSEITMKDGVLQMPLYSIAILK